MLFEKRTVVMLPTNEKAPLILLNDGFPDKTNPLMLYKLTLTSLDKSYWDYQHIYILGDEKIKEGDWCIMTNDFGDKYIVQVITPKTSDNDVEVKLILNNQRNCCDKNKLQKIIATTDKSLLVGTISQFVFDKNSRQRVNTEVYLPQPSDSFIKVFIEEYNKGNVITEVMVEYEKFKERHGDGRQFFMSERLKINRDNNINIKPIKDSWSREEVVNLFNKCEKDGIIKLAKESKDFNQWISKNL